MQLPTPRGRDAEADRRRKHLADLLPPQLIRVEEDGLVAILMERAPHEAVEARTVDEAIGELVVALRDLSTDWRSHLWAAVNFAEQHDLVRRLDSASDTDIAAWLMRGMALPGESSEELNG